MRLLHVPNKAFTSYRKAASVLSLYNFTTFMIKYLTLLLQGMGFSLKSDRNASCFSQHTWSEQLIDLCLPFFSRFLGQLTKANLLHYICHFPSIIQELEPLYSQYIPFYLYLTLNQPKVRVLVIMTSQLSRYHHTTQHQK